jgi:hypothetical protein
MTSVPGSGAVVGGGGGVREEASQVAVFKQLPVGRVMLPLPIKNVTVVSILTSVTGVLPAAIVASPVEVGEKDRGVFVVLHGPEVKFPPPEGLTLLLAASITVLEDTEPLVFRPQLPTKDAETGMARELPARSGAGSANV